MLRYTQGSRDRELISDQWDVIKRVNIVGQILNWLGTDDGDRRRADIHGRGNHRVRPDGGAGVGRGGVLLESDQVWSWDLRAFMTNSVQFRVT